MGDDETGTAYHQLAHGFLDQDLGSGVDAAGGFVEDENSGIGQHRASDSEQLLLALRDVSSLLIENGVVAIWQGSDAVIGLGSFGVRAEGFRRGILTRT